MRDYVTIGSAPCNEPCASVGQPDYYAKMKQETKCFIEQIRRHYPEPANGRLSVKAFDHDFGTYHEVVAIFQDDDEESVKWAFDVEGDTKGVLRNWDDES